MEIGTKVVVSENFEAHPSWIGRTGVIHQIEVGSMWDFMLLLDATDDENAAPLAVHEYEIELIQ